MVNLSKYHALKNDYLVFYNKNTNDLNLGDFSKIVCARKTGIGSDGLLIGEDNKSDLNTYNLRIFNPDGSEAEKSGNGLRIFCKFLFDNGYVKIDSTFNIKLKNEILESKILKNGDVELKIGKVYFLNPDDSINYSDKIFTENVFYKDIKIEFYRVSVGNPHCVLFNTKLDINEIGAFLEKHELFKNRTNVQIVEVIDENNIKINIWERGVGLTEASGTSSVATAALCYKIKKCNNNVNVNMDGGILNVKIDSEFNAVLTGNACHIAEIKIGELNEKIYYRNDIK